jgi:hypothetical protein
VRFRVADNAERDQIIIGVPSATPTAAYVMHTQAPAGEAYLTVILTCGLDGDSVDDAVRLSQHGATHASRDAGQACASGSSRGNVGSAGI